MVSQNKDMLGFDDAEPDKYGEVEYPIKRKVLLAKEIAVSGEAILELQNGDVVEIHGHGAHFYPTKGVIFTEDDDEEKWVFAEEIVSVGRH